MSTYNSFTSSHVLLSQEYLLQLTYSQVAIKVHAFIFYAALVSFNREQFFTFFLFHATECFQNPGQRVGPPVQEHRGRWHVEAQAGGGRWKGAGLRYMG